MGNATNGRLWQPWLKTLEKKVHKFFFFFNIFFWGPTGPIFSRNNSKHFFRIFVFFKFRETIETWRNSDLFCTVSHFAKLKKKKLSTLPRTVKKYVSSFPFYELGKKVYLVCQELCGSGSQFFSLLQLWD